MSHTLANKYRPKSLDEVVGQEVSVQIIRNSFKKKIDHHAYLLEGPLGSGKTTLARILALLLNTQLNPDDNPDLSSKQVRDILNGTSIDVQEIDAASNNSVENIRQLIKDAEYSPVQGYKKVYILDETHMLSKSAFNSLLKILEEPPESTAFILCTTEPKKIIDTVKSRCLQLNLFKLDWRQIFSQLKLICQFEKLVYEEKALKIIAQNSSGSMRNALNILEKAIIFSENNELKIDYINKILGSIDDKYYFALLNKIFTKDLSSSIKIINKIVLISNNADYTIKRLEEHMINLLNIKICDEDLVGENLSDDEIKKYKHIGKAINIRLVARIIELLVDVHKGLEVNMDFQSMLETWAVNSIMAIDQFLKQKHIGENSNATQGHKQETTGRVS